MRIQICCKVTTQKVFRQIHYEPAFSIWEIDCPKFLLILFASIRMSIALLKCIDTKLLGFAKIQIKIKNEE